MVTTGLHLSSVCLSNLPFFYLPLFKPLSIFKKSPRLQRNALQRFCFQGERSRAHQRSRPRVRSSLKSTLKLKKRPSINSTRWTTACYQHNIYLVCTIKQTLHAVATNQHWQTDIAQYCWKLQRCCIHCQHKCMQHCFSVSVNKTSIDDCYHYCWNYNPLHIQYSVYIWCNIIKHHAHIQYNLTSF